ncbi:MAG: hypothetical protein ACOYNZ_08445 [Rhodoferax sp.]
MQNEFWLADDLTQRRLFARPTLWCKLKAMPVLGWWVLGLSLLLLLVSVNA